ncbi:hypothetical protein KAJ77_02170, partial [bacterium]|nr:hypothetical protein [bacterium]
FSIGLFPPRWDKVVIYQKGTWRGKDKKVKGTKYKVKEPGKMPPEINGPIKKAVSLAFQRVPLSLYLIIIFVI